MSHENGDSGLDGHESAHGMLDHNSGHMQQPEIPALEKIGVSTATAMNVDITPGPRMPIESYSILDNFDEGFASLSTGAFLLILGWHCFVLSEVLLVLALLLLRWCRLVQRAHHGRCSRP